MRLKVMHQYDRSRIVVVSRVFSAILPLPVASPKRYAGDTDIDESSANWPAQRGRAERPIVRSRTAVG